MSLWISSEPCAGKCAACGLVAKSLGVLATFRIGPQDDEDERPLVMVLCEDCTAVIGAQFTRLTPGVGAVLQQARIPKERGSA